MAVQEGMVLVKQSCIGWQVVLEQCLISRVGIAKAFRHDNQSLHDPAGIGVDDEGRFARCIDYDVVRCFRADAVNREKLNPQLFDRLGQQPFQAASVVYLYVLGEGL